MKKLLDLLDVLLSNLVLLGTFKYFRVFLGNLRYFDEAIQAFLHCLAGASNDLCELFYIKLFKWKKLLDSLDESKIKNMNVSGVQHGVWGWVHGGVGPTMHNCPGATVWGENYLQIQR